MATTSKLTAFNGYYGYDSFTNSAASHIYVGAANSSTKYDYRSRLTFKPLSSIASIGSNRIKITKALLYVHRNDGGPTTISVGCSASSAWNASLAATKSYKVDSASKWYEIDITNLANAIGGYAANWYIHLRNGTPRLRLYGTSSNYIPYIKITWEYVAATITSSHDEAVLGNEILFTIAPEVEGETHTLTYSIEDQTGTIAEKVGNDIIWVPSLDLATEFPNDDTITATIRMQAYNAAGNVIRTELYYQTLRITEDMKPMVQSIGMIMNSDIGGYALAGRTSLTLSPIIDINACYGALLSTIKATITNGNTVQELIWENATELDPGIYSGLPLTSAKLESSGEALIHLIATDTRGCSSEISQNITVLSYSPPKINDFSVERYEAVYDNNEEISGYIPSDLGGYVWVNINASVCEIAPEGAQLNKLSWRIDGVSLSRSAVGAEGVGDQTIIIAEDRDIFPDAVDEGESWQYTLTVTDTAGGAAAQYSTILPAHAAMSVSPDKYGLAIGMIASGRRGRPRFEVDKRYKSHFYGGVYGADGYRMDRCEQWEYLDITNGNFAAYSAAFRPRISRVGAIVFLDGMVKNTAELDASFNVAIAALPEWAKPVTDVHALQQGSGRAVWWLRITAAGAVIIQRYRDESGYVGAPETSQFPLSLSWIAADAFVESVEGEVIATYADGMVALTDTGDCMEVIHDGAGNVTIEKYSGVNVAFSEGNVAIEQEE